MRRRCIGRFLWVGAFISDTPGRQHGVSLYVLGGWVLSLWIYKLLKTSVPS